jgi:hypothetical protein
VLFVFGTLAVACSNARMYQQPSLVSETLTLRLPDGFGKQAALAQAISAAAVRTESEPGISGSVDIQGPFNANGAYPVATSSTGSRDPYIQALTDAQNHAAELSKATGVALGTVTSISEDRDPAVVTRVPNRIVLEVKYGDSLTVYGSSEPLQSTSAYGGSGLNVQIRSTGTKPADAKASVDALEQAVRATAASFGISGQAVQVVNESIDDNR